MFAAATAGIVVVAYALALHASPFPRDDVVSAGQFKARTYFDPQTRTVFYVETDGRHLSAIGPDGTLLWTRNPYVDTGSHYYRGKEVIAYLGPLSANFTQFMKKLKRAGAIHRSRLRLDAVWGVGREHGFLLQPGAGLMSRGALPNPALNPTGLWPAG